MITNLSITAVVYLEFKMLILYQLQAKPKSCSPIEVHVEHLWPKYDSTLFPHGRESDQGRGTVIAPLLFAQWQTMSHPCSWNMRLFPENIDI